MNQEGRMTITFKTNNAAFEGENLYIECARIFADDSGPMGAQGAV